MPSIGRTPPTATEYVALRATVGFGTIDLSTAEAVLGSTLACVTARDDDRAIVGFARAVGDGRLYAFITDVFVHPSAQGRGIGESLMEELVTELVERAATGATIALLAAPGREDFYARFGFATAPNEVFGSGMVHLSTMGSGARSEGG